MAKTSVSFSIRKVGLQCAEIFFVLRSKGHRDTLPITAMFQVVILR